MYMSMLLLTTYVGTDCLFPVIKAAQMEYSIKRCILIFQHFILPLKASLYWILKHVHISQKQYFEGYSRRIMYQNVKS